MVTKRRARPLWTRSDSSGGSHTFFFGLWRVLWECAGGALTRIRHPQLIALLGRRQTPPPVQTSPREPKVSSSLGNFCLRRADCCPPSMWPDGSQVFAPREERHTHNVTKGELDAARRHGKCSEPRATCLRGSPRLQWAAGRIVEGTKHVASFIVFVARPSSVSGAQVRS